LNRLLPLLVVVALGVGGWWLYRHLYPPHEQRIRQTLREAAGTVSFRPDTGNLARLAAINRLATYFTEDAEVLVEVPGAPSRQLTGRDDVRQVAAGTQAAVQSIEVRLREMAVELHADRESAQVHVVVDVRIDGSADPWISEFKLGMAHRNGNWLIQRIEPVRGLAM
jgi:ketosteroid isomerase-like protein